MIGRLMVETQPDFETPRITRLAVLDASEESHGNIVGAGFADLATERLISRLDPSPFRINVLTSSFLERARIPIGLPTDRDVFAAAVETCWRSQTGRGSPGHYSQHARSQDALGFKRLRGRASDTDRSIQARD